MFGFLSAKAKELQAGYDVSLYSCFRGVHLVVLCEFYTVLINIVKDACSHISKNFPNVVFDIGQTANRTLYSSE